jgi:energy-coupling factor transporter ATP-binding protein EcfA2
MKGLMDRSLEVRGRGVTGCFDDVVALDRVDLDVTQGQIHGLVGPNGAGKTTLLGLLLGLAAADSGRLEIPGTPVGRALAGPDGVAGVVDGSGLYGHVPLDATADGRCIAEGDGPKEVNGYFLVRTPTGEAPNPLWQFDGNVDLLSTSPKG